MTTFKKHTWPGLAQPVYLPDWIVVEVKIIPASVDGWTSGISSTRQVKTTFHDTGNPKTGATGEYNWAAGGGRVDAPGSYNGIFDAKRIIICQRFDELVGHAFNDEGNRTSYAFEQAYGLVGGGFDDSWKVGCWAHAAVIVAKGWQVDTALVKHQYWRRPDGTYKYCPAQILNRSAWSATIAQVSKNAAEIRAFLGGMQPVPVPTYAKPVLIPELTAVIQLTGFAQMFTKGGDAEWVWVGDRCRVAVDTPRYQRASKSSAHLNKNLVEGEEFDVDFVTVYNGEHWGYTPAGTRIFMDDVIRISDTKGG